MHSPYPHICTDIRKTTLNHLSSLAPDLGELGDFSPKGHGAHGPMPIALPFVVKEHIPGAPPGSGAGASLCCTTFQKAHQLSQPLSPSQRQDFHVIPFCCQLAALHGTYYVPSNPEHPPMKLSLCSQAWDTSSEITGIMPLVQGAAVNTQLMI